MMSARASLLELLNPVWRSFPLSVSSARGVLIDQISFIRVLGLVPLSAHPALQYFFLFFIFLISGALPRVLRIDRWI